MTALAWDETGQRFFETAVSKGVFYDANGYGVVWNGLIAVEETVTNEVSAVHFDGLKINDIVTIGDFAATMRAYTYPNEFLPYEGIEEDQEGFFVTGQGGDRFGLCYQTKIGNDIEGLAYGYKVHILYNLTAVPAQKSYQTMSLDTEPMEFEWSITSLPEPIENYKPTAHIIFDSTKMDPWLLQDLEDILYGDADHPPHLPPLKGLGTFIRKWERLIITDHGDGTWTADSPREEDIIMLDETTFEITADTAVYLDADSYEISSSDKNEEDIIWPL
jgi:hypothetical protein